MREEKEIREALKKLKGMVAIIGTLEWVLGDKKSLPDFA